MMKVKLHYLIESLTKEDKKEIQNLDNVYNLFVAEQTLNLFPP